MDAPWIHHFLCLHPCNGLTDHPHGLESADMAPDVLPDYICPFCYEDHDIAALCSHLEDEHSCEAHPVGCPVCSAKVSRDVLGHITLQHRHLFKLQRRRNFCKAGSNSNTSSPARVVPTVDDVSKQNAASKGTVSGNFVLAIEQDSEGKTEDFRQEHETKVLQAAFVRDLLLSLIFSES